MSDATLHDERERVRRRIRAAVGAALGLGMYEDEIDRLVSEGIEQAWRDIPLTIRQAREQYGDRAA